MLLFLSISKKLHNEGVFKVSTKIICYQYICKNYAKFKTKIVDNRLGCSEF